MISILIPTYNYNVTALFQSLKSELEIITPNYEIICYEDGSSKYVKANSSVISIIASAKHIIADENKGRLTTRQSLAKIAKYDWLLFLDADVIPNNPSFLQDYLKFVNLDYDAIYGGCDYDSQKPDSQFVLRWKYGRNYEHVDAKLRNKTPYKVVNSGNFLIKKEIFLEMNSKIENEGYGYDNYLGALMKLNDVKVYHINNNATHKGLDTSSLFLDKVEKSVDTIYEINQKYGATTTESTLLEFYKKIKSFGFSKLIAFAFKLSKARIRQQLLSSNPNLTLLQFYKLGYLCAITPNKK